MRASAVYHCQLAWLGGDEPAGDVRIDVDLDRGVITAIRAGAALPPGATRLQGVTLPGLANVHSHVFHRALRGRTQRGPGSFWTWREDMYRLAALLDPDTYHRLARAAFAEMVLAGITTVGEFHYLHHRPDGGRYANHNAMGEALIAAAGEAGLRLTLLDACYLGSGLAPDGSLRPPDPAQRAFSDVTAHTWAERVAGLSGGPRVRIGAAVHSVRTVDARSLPVVAGLAGERSFPLHAHVSEQPAENEQCDQAHGMTPVALLSSCGALSHSFTAIHATHASEADLVTLATAGAGVCLCPTTERDLADGIGPTAGLRRHGIEMSVGSDSQAVVDLFEELRAAELDERLATGTRGNHRVAELLAAATANGHRQLGWPEAGRIELGAPADLVTVDLSTVRTAGSCPRHALATVVYAATAADVTGVIVAGEVVVLDGRHRSIDAAGELDAAIAGLWRGTP
ncbi:MAG: formimidoylglutamate deiminase [Acidimicrobiia bacterium]|nr:formimidoylglutamate deiminase [Acidimicrobiia bacterium]